MAVARAIEEEKVSSSKKKAVSSSKPRSKTGSQAKKRVSTKAKKQAEPMTPEEQTGAEAALVDGAKQLQDAANKVAAAQSDQIARGLAKKATEGNPACTKMLLELIAGKTVTPKKLRRALTGAQDLKRDTAWEAPVKQGTGTDGLAT